MRLPVEANCNLPPSEPAAAERPTASSSVVALLLELKSPSENASIPAATTTASVPVPSSGA